MRKTIDSVSPKAMAEEAGQDLGGEELLELVHTLMHQLRSAQYQALRDSKGLKDLTHLESKVLGFFGRNPGATQSDLAQYSGRDKAQLARLIRGMRERGLLNAETDPEDRRHQRLSLTPAGEALRRTVHGQGRQVSKQAMAGMAVPEQQQLIALLRHVRDNLQPRRSDD